MSGAFSVRFEGVSKAYRRATSDYRTLRDVIVRRRIEPPEMARARRPALTDVSLTVSPGESYALVGPNGAGKTSALRLVARISRPTRGTVSVRGRVGALMEVGSGIHPELTARENVWMYGSILGLSRRQIATRFDDILQFAELEDFSDRQVRYFSSGMQLRLGFAVASHLEPDVFVVDEALAVGDAAFQAKCLERMHALVQEGTTLLFVSHNLSAVETLCSRGALIVDGQLVTEGSTADVLKQYLAHIDAKRGSGPLTVDDGPLSLLGVELRGPDQQPTETLEPGSAAVLSFHFHAREPLRKPHLNVGVTDGRPGLLLQCSMLRDGGAPDVIEGPWRVDLNIEELPLLPRVYSVWCDVFQADAQSSFYPWTEVLQFRVERRDKLGGPLQVMGDYVGAPILTKHRWS